MFPDPLHPAIVHLPMALAVLLPLVSVLGYAAIYQQWLPVRAWSGVVLLTGALVLGSWAALETGEQDEERVERVVAESRIEAHEEAAEAFAALGLVLFVIAAAGLTAGRVGELARLASLPLSLALLVAGVRVGHAGGELVYQHGAAQAHVEAAIGSPRTLVDADHDDDSD